MFSALIGCMVSAAELAVKTAIVAAVGGTVGGSCFYLGTSKFGPWLEQKGDDAGAWLWDHSIGYVWHGKAAPTTPPPDAAQAA